LIFLIFFVFFKASNINVNSTRKINGHKIYALKVERVPNTFENLNSFEMMLKMLKTMQIYQKCIFWVFIIFFAIFGFFLKNYQNMDQKLGSNRLDKIRADVLQMQPFPTVEQAYAQVRREDLRQFVMLKNKEVISGGAMLSGGEQKPQHHLSLSHVCGVTARNIHSQILSNVANIERQGILVFYW
jgi:hypothetical protein